jgi:hypothetical protein
VLDENVKVGVSAVLEPRMQVSVGGVLSGPVRADVAKDTLHGLAGVQVLKVDLLREAECCSRLYELLLKLRRTV